MKARSLIRWSNLEQARRKQDARGLAALPEIVVSVLLGGVLATEITRRLLMAPEHEMTSTAISASHLWVAAAVCGYAIGVFGAPFRLYWRSDSKLLASLPVPGQSLFALALWRSSRTALQISLALAVALLPLGALLDWEFSLRHLLPIGIGFVGAAWLGPAAALGAGAVVASDKAQAMIASMGGEFQAPRTSWLGILPGLAATAVAIGVIACSSWVVGGRPPGGSIAVIAIACVLVSAGALIWAWARAERVILAAVREVAALDQEILAHVERSTASSIERAVASLLSRRSRLVALKDAALLRRRYPSPYFMIPCGIVAIWIVAGMQPASYLPWGGAFYGGILVYAILIARRAEIPPIEIPGLVRTLPITTRELARAKNSLSLIRLGVIAVAGGLPLLLRASDVLSAGIFVALATGLSLLAGSRRPS